jgi:hypothetical protein
MWLGLPLLALLSGCIGVAVSVFAPAMIFVAASAINEALTSIVVSLHPLGTEESAPLDQRLEGQWVLGDPSAPAWIVTITPLEDTYDIKISRREDQAGLSCTAKLVTIGESRYVDLQHQKSSLDLLTLQPHLLMRLDFDEDALRLKFLDRAKIQCFLDQEAPSVSAETMGERMLLTSQPAALKTFLREHGHEVTGKVDLVLRRK